MISVAKCEDEYSRMICIMFVISSIDIPFSTGVPVFEIVWYLLNANCVKISGRFNIILSLKII